jgi:hypothetical protein
MHQWLEHHDARTTKINCFFLIFSFAMFLMLWKNIKKLITHTNLLFFKNVPTQAYIFLYLCVLRWIQRARCVQLYTKLLENKFMCIYLHALVQQQKQRWAVSMATQGAWRHTLTSHVTAMNAAIMIGGAQWERANTHQRPEREKLKETFAGICYSLALFSHVCNSCKTYRPFVRSKRTTHKRERSAKTQSGSSLIANLNIW